MSTNKTNPAKKDQKLTSIEEQLLTCASSGQPVLLHGKTAKDYIRLVLYHTHEMIGGISKSVEYPIPKEILIQKKKLKGEIERAEKSRDVKSMSYYGDMLESLYRHSKSKLKTWDYVDCGGMTAEEVYIELVMNKSSNNLTGMSLENRIKLIKDKKRKHGLFRILLGLKNQKIPNFECHYCNGYLFVCGGTLFVDNLHCRPGNNDDYERYLELAKIIKTRKIDNEQTAFNWLVVYVYDPKGFPNYFREQFEEINLKLADQASTPKFNTEPQEVVPFPTPPGAKWEELKISFIDKETVNITIRNNTKKMTYAEMGFKDKRTCKPIKGWELLKMLAGRNGQLSGYPDMNKSKIEKEISGLRGKLTAYFNINEDPIPYITLKNDAGYKTAFTLENKSYMNEYEVSIRNRDCFEKEDAKDDD